MTGVIPSLGRMPSLGKLATHGRPDYWTTLGRIQSGMVLDFTSASIADALAAYGFAFTRASTATRFTSSGVMETVASGAMRIDHDPVTRAPLGYLCEETSTNHVRNSTMVGVVTGSPGTLPTNWSSADAGLTRTVVGSGTESGMAYVDVRWNGTSSSTLAQVLFDTSTAIAASASQAWTGSVYLRLVDGSLANVNSIGSGITYRDSGGSGITSATTNFSVTSGGLLSQRASHTSTSPALTAYSQLIVNVSVVNGAAIDFTLRIGAPQLEQRAFATSFIPTAGSALTRQLDALTLGDLSRIGFNPSASSVIAQGRILGQSALVYPGVVALGMGVEGDKVVLYRDGASSRFIVDAKTAGVIQYSLSVTAAPATGAEYKTAFAFAANDASQTTSGAAPVKDTSVALSTILDRMSIGGFQARGGGTNGAQIIRRVDYYPRRLPDAELQTLTT